MEIIKALELHDGTILVSEDCINNHYATLVDTVIERIAATFSDESEESISEMLKGEEYKYIKSLVEVYKQHNEAMDLWQYRDYSYE